MRKRIRLLAVIALVFAFILLLGGLGLLYLQKTSNLPVENPVASTPKTLALTKLLAGTEFNLSGVPFESNGVIKASISGSLVLFSSLKDLKTQVKALQLLSGRLKMEPARPKEIDLRFDKVVLRY